MPQHHRLVVQLDPQHLRSQGGAAWGRSKFLQLEAHRHHVSLDLWWQHRFAHLGQKRPHLGGDDREVLRVHLVSRNEHRLAAQQTKGLSKKADCVQTHAH